MSASEAAVRLLVACLRNGVLDVERASRLLDRTTTGHVLKAAAYHAVSGIAFEKLRDLPGVEPELASALKDRYDSAVGHHLLIVWELARLQPVLGATGGSWAVIKGPVAAELLYDAPGQRYYGDLDVLVDPSQFDTVIDCLARSGSRLLDRNWKAIRGQLRGELHFELPGGSLLDLHWNLVNMYRGGIRIDTPALLARTEQVEIGGMEILTLDPTDTVIHLALHGTLSGGDRLLWMKDIAQACLRRPPEWDELAVRANAWNVSRPVGFMLSRASGVLGARIPTDVPRRLLGRRYAFLSQLADRISPWQRAEGRITTPGLILTRSMGYGMLGAARWLATRAVRNMDPREPAISSSFAPRGGQEDYDAFIRAVVTSTIRK